MKSTIYFKNKPAIVATSTICGPKESDGNLGEYVETRLLDDMFGEDTYEKAECKMLSHVIEKSIQNADIKLKDVDCLISGDLLNQIISSSFSAREFDVPYLGVYNACSTMCEALAISAVLVDGGYMSTTVAATGSHFSTAERQFRYPLELGCQRPPTAQWTVTGAGCSIVGKEGNGHNITHVTFGKVVDFGINDMNNMGAAMAPAAADTLKNLFNDTNTVPSDYDLIVTGDLGKLGSEILVDLLEYYGFKVGENYCDCGQMIFSNTQKSFMGGSGCGCSASMFNSYILSKLDSGEYKKVIMMSTGALLSTTSAQQGETIPGIAHAIIIEKAR